VRSAHTGGFVLKNSLKKLQAEGESGVIQPKSIRAVSEVVDLANANGYMFTGHDVKTTAKLTRPTVVGSADAVYMTATEQSMNERLELILLGALGEAGTDQIGKGAALDPVDVLTGICEVAFKGPPLPKVNGGRCGKAEQIPAAYRCLKSINSYADR
jgi:hypothetical protein